MTLARGVLVLFCPFAPRLSVYLFRFSPTYCCYLDIYLTYPLHIVISYIPYFYPFSVALLSSFYCFPVQNIAMIIPCSYPSFKFLVISAPRPFGGQHGPLSLELTRKISSVSQEKIDACDELGRRLTILPRRFSDSICERST